MKTILLFLSQKSNSLRWTIAKKSLLAMIIFIVFNTSGFGVWGQVSTYSFTNTSGIYTNVTGTTYLLNSDDASSAVQNIGFTFNFNSTNFTQFVANSNGSIRFGTAGPTSQYTPLSTTSNTNAIAACARDGRSRGGVITAIQGVAPNRVCVIQYTNFDLTYTSTANSVSFQIRLYETTNVVEIIYGGSARTTTYTPQIGLRGSTLAADFNNRMGASTNWAGNPAGTANTSTVTWSTTSFPSSGRIFRWTPPAIAGPTAPCTNTIAFGSLAAPTVPGAQTISTCTYQTEYNTITGIVAGQSYTIGSSCGGYISVRRDTPGGTVVGHGAAPYTFTAPTSGTYYIHYNTNSSCGTASTCCTTTITCNSCTAAPTPPSNDLVCSATAISCGATLSGTTVNATNSGTGEGGSCGTAQTQPGVWYVVAGNGQTMTASLCGTAWDSKISVYSGANCSTLTCVGGNDDGGPACTGTSASYSWSSVTGTNYYILVHGYSSTSAFSINLSCVTPPPPTVANDLVCSATAISCGATLSGTTVNATNSGTGEGGSCGTAQTQPGVWYVVAGNGQTMTASLCGTAWDSKISVYSGANCSTLACVGGNDDAGPACAGTSASYSWNSVSGTNYYILVHGYSSTSAFDITLSCVNPAPADPTSISVAETSGVSNNDGTICSGASVTLTAVGGVGTVYWFTGSCATTGQINTGNSITVSPTSTTTYFARNFNGGQWSAGCASATITVNANPTVSATANPATICVGQNSQLEAVVGGVSSPGTLVVTVSNGGWMDEVSWTLTNSLGATIGSGGPYGLGGSYSLTIGSSANGPYTFNLETQGTFNDNIADYVITCNGTTVLSGTLTGGLTTSQAVSACLSAPAATYAWTPSATLSNAGIMNPLASPSSNTTYTALVTVAGCQGSGQTTVTVNNPTLATAPANGDVVWRGATSVDWATPSNWYYYNGSSYTVAGVSPNNTTRTIIPSNQSCVTQQPSVAAGTTVNAKDVVIETGATLTITTGTLNVNGNFTNNGTFVAGTGTVAFNTAATVSGNATTFNNVDVNNGVNFGSNLSTINGTMTINNGGWVNTNPPTYGLNSLLKYNTGGVYGRYLEWSATSGPGYPNDVQVSNNTTINYPSTGGAFSTNLGLRRDLTIDAGSNLYMDYGTGNASGSLTVGRNVTAAGDLSLGNQIGGDIYVGGNWTRTSGNFYANNRAVFFIGATGNQTITKTGGETFPYMVVNKASGNVVLANNVTVSGGLTLTSGLVELGTNNMIMGSASLTGGSSTSYVKTTSTGVLSRNVGGSAVAFPVGNSSYNRAVLTNTGVADIFTLRVIDNVTADGTGIGALTSEPVVQRTWMVNETNIGGSNVTLRLYWNGFSEEINSFVQPSAFIAHYLSSAGTWDNIGKTNEGADFVETNNITSFSPFAISSSGTFAPLPIELVSFQANCKDDNSVAVTWVTASEHNTSHYVVEKSRDGITWSVLGQTAAAGNSTELLTYEMIDSEKASGTTYYRLTQFDNDGVFEMFDPVSVNCNGTTSNNHIMTYPNPSSESFYVSLFTETMEGNGQLTITDASGRPVYQQSVSIQNGNNVFHIGNMNAAPGMYYIQVTQRNTTTDIVKHSLR